MLGVTLGAIIQRPAWAFAASVPVFGFIRLVVGGLRSTLASPASLIQQFQESPPNGWVLHAGYVPLGRTSPALDVRGREMPNKLMHVSTEYLRSRAKRTVRLSLTCIGFGSISPKGTTGCFSGQRRALCWTRPRLFRRDVDKSSWLANLRQPTWRLSFKLSVRGSRRQEVHDLILRQCRSFHDGCQPQMNPASRS